jgi:uncharacterized membrane protein (UPF0127 family)
VPQPQRLVFDGAHERVVCERCVVADRPHSRLRGLIGRRELAIGDGLLLRPTPSIHTWFMRFPIDVVFLDAELRVLGVRPELRPWRLAGRRRTRAVLELPGGEARRVGLEPGAVLQFAGPKDGTDGS